MNKYFLLFFLFSFSTISGASTLKTLNELKRPFSLPALPYSMNSLEEVIDTETMTIHHGKHHQAYINNLNNALDKKNKETLQNILSNVSKHGTAIRNNGGGHWNHSFFWTILSGKKEDQVMPKELQAEIERNFKTLDNFKAEFEKKGSSLFGSGWVWLIRNTDGALEITTTINQDNPMMDLVETKGTPIFALDVWEHAYYLKYQNKRADYLKNFWKIVNWRQVEAYRQESLSH